MHYASYKNMYQASKVLIDFVLQDISSTNETTPGGETNKPAKEIPPSFFGRTHEERKRNLQNWLNEASTGDDGFTALHFASFHGNMQIVKLLVEYGADIHARTKAGINMLHVSAQGDQPVSLVYFLDKGLDINAEENRGSSPLHWAAFSGSELTLNYIVSYGGNVH